MRKAEPREGQRATTPAEEHLGPDLANEVASRARCSKEAIGCRKPGRLIFLDVPGYPTARGTTPEKAVDDLRRRAKNMELPSPSTG